MWVLAKGFFVNEQTCKMNGKSEYKSRCRKFKQLGDGLQGDCIADDGYMWDFYFWNEPCDPELLAEGYCPMHCRLLHMFMNLHESGPRCKWTTYLTQSNLHKLRICFPTQFSSTEFCRRADKVVLLVL